MRYRKITQLAAAIGLAVASTSAVAQSAECEYIIQDDWNTGAVSTIRITNTGDTSINGWSLEWSYDTNRISSLWNADLQGNNPYTASNVSWNGNIAPQQSVEFGMQIEKNGGEAEIPTLGGDLCSGSSTPPVDQEPPVDPEPPEDPEPPVEPGDPSDGLTFDRLRNLADFPIGVAVPAGNETHSIFDNDFQGEGQREVVTQHFSEITAENIMKMSYLHNQLGQFTFGDADQLVDWALSHNIDVHGHALVWHPSYQVPNWAQNFQGSEQEWLDALLEHVTGVASHFSGRVHSWDVVNEAFIDSGYRTESVWYQNIGPRYIEESFIAARAAAPDAVLYYNDYSMENGQPKFDHAIAMVDDFQARGIPIDGIGFQFHVLIDWPSTQAMRQVFSEVVDRGLMVKITELDIPVNNPYDGQYSFPDNYIAEFTDEAAQRQKRRFCEVVEAYLDEVPPAQRGGISVWGVFDSASWLIPETFQNNHDEWPLLFNDNFEPKPAAQGVGDALMGLSCN